MCCISEHCVSEKPEPEPEGISLPSFGDTLYKVSTYKWRNWRISVLDHN